MTWSRRVWTCWLSMGLGCGPTLGPLPADGADSETGSDSAGSEGSGAVDGDADAGSGSDGGSGSGNPGTDDGLDESGDEGSSPACPDGTLDPGEDCDDGNAIDGDGCNQDCRVSGSTLWEVELDDAEAQAVRFDDASTVTAVAVGYNGGPLTLLRFDEDGGAQWSRELDGDSLIALDVSAEGEPATYTQISGSQPPELVTRFGDDGEIVWQADDHFSGWGSSIVAKTDAVVMSDTGWAIRRYNAAGQIDWGIGIGEPSRLVGALDTGVYALGDGVAGSITGSGSLTWLVSTPCTGPSTVDPVSGDLWIASDEATPEITVCVVSPEGMAGPTRTVQAEDTGTIRSIGADANGNLVAAVRIAVSTSYRVEKHHPDLGLVHSHPIQGFRDLDVDAGTGRIATAGYAITVFAP